MVYLMYDLSMDDHLAPNDNDFHRALFRRVKAALEGVVFDGVPQDEAATGKAPSPLDPAGLL